jgi:hypothetical protein
MSLLGFGWSLLDFGCFLMLFNGFTGQRHVNLKEITFKWFVAPFKMPPVARRILGGI